MTAKWIWHETDKELPDRIGEYLVVGERNCVDVADFNMRKFTYPAYHLGDTWTLTSVTDITDKVVQWAEIPWPSDENTDWRL